MRALYLLVLIFNLFLLQGDGLVSTSSLQKAIHTSSATTGNTVVSKINSIHVNSLLSKALTERSYNLTEDDVEDELIFESYSTIIFKDIAFISYALALIFILKNLDSRLSIFRKQPFTSTNKYILQRVLRL
ncbi:hypothetical protein KO02_01585 [Sphingobacterium sp. ML3W]|uniref:hypothetical protein n=1 Tax=Sphingobacterium sp. ML3W TaxID=1538644 RepID=UPI0004F6377D|nr:hypothetical protein [Sphingobacterium sp. ML3W]AIM35496.1 hypothetical protein KO02_01585 [Sphingobacterium sp. ML3W]